MIDLEDEELAFIKKILSEYVPECEVRIFGSRLNGDARSHSDLDLVLLGDGKIKRLEKAELKNVFEESSLPFRVDVLDWHAISDNFKKIINQNYEIIQKLSEVKQ